MEDRQQTIALFRYSLIREISDPELDPRQKGMLMRVLAGTDHARGDGRRIEVSVVTLRRWLRAWSQGGFENLQPAVRQQPNRTPAKILEAAEALKREAPKRTAAQVSRALVEAGVGKVSARTLRRHFARLGLSRGSDNPVKGGLGRFEAAKFGDLWTGDGLHGPMVEGKKAILFAFIDDWSRAVLGWRWGYAEDTICLEAALRRGLEGTGIPSGIFVDNGSAFISQPFHRTLAVLGIRIIHSRPGHPASRGKIERFFQTVRSWFLVEIEARGGVKDLTELNELFGAWLEGVYHRSVHSETKETPLARRLAGGKLRQPTPAELKEAFLWAVVRSVTKTSTVSLFGNHFEVDPALCGSKVELRFDPFDLTEIEVFYQGRPMGRAIPQRISRHTHPLARQQTELPAKPSGIDYLALVAARVARDEGSRITYSDFSPPLQPQDPEGPAALENIT